MKNGLRRRGPPAAALLYALMLCAATHGGEATVPADAATGRPSFRAGDWLRIDFRTKIQLDFRRFRPALSTSHPVVDARRVRVGAEGVLWRDFEFELEFDLEPTDHQVRDASVNYRRFRASQVRAGKFRVPFGRDQLTDPMDLDFVYRSRIGSTLAPGRDIGVMAHGDLREGSLRYSAGVFRHDGEVAEIQDLTQERDYLSTGGRTLAARLTAAPFAMLRAPRLLDRLEFGVAATRGEVPEGIHSLRGRSISGDTFFPRMYSAGTRTRKGAELVWRLGSLALQGEYMVVREERLRQSLQGTDLPALRASGWYVSATHPVIGRRPGPGAGFFGSFVPGLRLGMVEAAARYDEIRFGGEAGAGAPSRSPRAVNVAANRDRAWTLGLNWFATRYTKLQANAIHETLLDPARTPIAGVSRYWTLAGRFQFGF